MSEETKYWWDNNPTCVSGLKNTINSWQEPYKGEYPKSVTLPYSGGEPEVMLLKTGNPTATSMINWPYIKELNYTFDQSGSFTEPTSFDNSNYWRKDRSPQHE